MQSSQLPQIAILLAEMCTYSSTEMAVANELKSSASAVGIHFGQSMNRRALTKWGSVRIRCH